MASAVCQNQFLGSRISLISKSEIRYEGILYALDLCEATISLAKVRSFGTEDRPTERPIPPKDEVFEYIIFRGSDIKAIDVVETPKHAANSGMPGGVPADPAIVDFSHSGGNGFHYDGGRPRPNGSTRRGGPQVYTGGHGNNMRNRSFEYTNDAGIQVGRGNMNRGSGGQGGGGGRQYGQPGGRNNFGGNAIFRQGGGGFNQNNGGQYQQRGRMTTPNRGGNYGQPQQRRGGRPQGGGGNRTPFRNRGMNQAAFPPKVSFDGDYDFEKANEELLTSLAKAKLEDGENADNKSDDETQNKEEQEIKDHRTFYKKDNFFDNISCESLERSKGNVPRVDWKAERKLNAETFGLPPSPNGNGQTRISRYGGGQRMPRGGNMMMFRGPGAGYWMSPSHMYRGGPRRPRMRNNIN